jgi:hypothetical protein
LISRCLRVFVTTIRSHVNVTVVGIAARRPYVPL